MARWVLRYGRIKKHWEAIERYNAHINDPANLESLTDGFIGFSNPPDPELDLVALTTLGELEFADLVLPDAPNCREARLYWMEFVEEHDDIIYPLGNPSYTAFSPSGDQPLHLQFGYLPTCT